MLLLIAVSDLYFKSEYPARLAPLLLAAESGKRNTGKQTIDAFGQQGTCHEQESTVVTKQYKRAYKIFRMQ